jgi:hypothetical protein
VHLGPRSLLRLGSRVRSLLGARLSALHALPLLGLGLDRRSVRSDGRVLGGQTGRKAEGENDRENSESGIHRFSP